MQAILSARNSMTVTRADLARIPAPTGTRTWKPISHYELVLAILQELERRGIQVMREEYALQRNHTRLFGVMDLAWYSTTAYGAALGLRQGNDKRLAIQIAAGASVFVCDNLCMSGDLIALRRKHTARLELTKEIAGAIDRYQERMVSLTAGIQRLKEERLSDAKARDLIYQVFAQRLVPLRLFHAVHQTFFQENHSTVWKLYNAFTLQLKTLTPASRFQAHIRLGRFFLHQ